ncbi:2OG-Fe dioxygenase family protein [Rhizobacter sp. Root1221]|uniref:2OG-Fe dioxygenase family protein n=1 Tax=Rhizobacter sp. Root1221 TaxID=1736433 RepID=UPI0006FCE228|nr:2OG-Fe dioxygenase family protein [Rhizobacter sp. Root1221]KQV96939.1 hypothetical protein ASC87_23995 [Rhizobacter sp. Root1221]
MTHDTLEDRSVETALIEGFASHLHSQQFLFVPGNALGDMLALTPEDISGFASHWPRLTLDRHMGDGGTYRFRRYGAFDAPPGSARRQLPHGPYEQPKYINSLNGDIARMFDPLEPTFASHTVLNRLLDWLTSLYDQCEGRPRHWNIRLHPYRILANQDEKGNPTPEGLHRDGVDYIVSLMISRRNVTGGETTVTDNDRQVLWQKTLQRPLDILIGKDAHSMHSVSPVSPVDPSQKACRDVLVIAFTKVAP